MTNPTKAINTKRSASSYDADYLKNRDNILAYQKTHKEEIKDYMREYMKSYRLTPQFKETHNNQTTLRQYLTGRLPNSQKAVLKLGMDKVQLAAHFGFTDLTKFSEFVKSREVDHIVGKKWVRDNYPELLPFVYRYYNTQFVPKKGNRSKGAYVDGKNIKVREIVTLMQMDLIKTQVEFSREDIKKMNRLTKEVKLLRAGNN